MNRAGFLQLLPLCFTASRKPLNTWKPLFQKFLGGLTQFMLRLFCNLCSSWMPLILQLLAHFFQLHPIVLIWAHNDILPLLTFAIVIKINAILEQLICEIKAIFLFLCHKTCPTSEGWKTNIETALAINKIVHLVLSICSVDCYERHNESCWLSKELKRCAPGRLYSMPLMTLKWC